MTEITLGGVPATKPESRRISLFLWGQAGVGKTTFATTLPGRKALINFDPDGPASVADADDVQVFDFSGQADTIVTKLITDNPLGIKDVLEHFDSFIFDSLTTVEEKALGYGIRQTNGATIIRPSPGAYGARGNVLVQFVRTVLSITGGADKHVCFIGHEAPASTDEDGKVLNIPPALGGKAPQNIALRVNECWAMFENTSRQKLVSVRKSRLREPLKTRMFDASKEAEFIWNWNVANRDDPKNLRLEDIFEQWKANGFKKLPMPKV